MKKETYCFVSRATTTEETIVSNMCIASLVKYTAKGANRAWDKQIENKQANRAWDKQIKNNRSNTDCLVVSSSLDSILQHKNRASILQHKNSASIRKSKYSIVR